MNKAITDGVLLMPPAFENGLDVWSRGDGTPGSDGYDTASNANFVPADQDFGGCLEVIKTSGTVRLRYKGETPLLPGCYLQIRARLKVLSGPLPSVRIAGWAGGAGGNHVEGLDETGPATALSRYGDIFEVSAIVGPGQRGGVDMVWSRQALYGHFGLDLTGPNGAVVRIDDLEIVDITGAYLRDMLGTVDVRDFGAVGDGSTDDSAAFEAADDEARGRRILVPAGTYRLQESVTLKSPVTFEGKVSMPINKMLILTRSFDLPTYIDAFGSEEAGFRRAFQALLNNADHESLDMRGRKITLTKPIDMAAAVPNRDSYATRRVIRNGQIEARAGANWDTETVLSQATYDPSDARRLKNVVNVANVPVGALVQGVGVGREVYVRARNIGAQELTLSAPLYDAAGAQNFTFRRFKYMLDFSGFSQLSKFGMKDIEFQCNGEASGILLAPSGLIFNLSGCFISRPKNRGISSIGEGCQGMLIDECQFLSSEDALNVVDRKSIALNTNANDVKLRNCRATRFRHFAILGGANNVVIGNHFFQGDGLVNGVRSAGLILTATHTSTNFTGNYVDNCFIEWSNEQDPAPEFSSEFSFSALSISDNVFLCTNVAPWFSYIVVKPHGAGHFVAGLSVTGNKFRSTQGNIDRVERVDTSFADLNYARMKDHFWAGNSFHGIDTAVANPLRVHHEQATVSSTWTVETNGALPFQSRARFVDAIVPEGPIQTSGNTTRYVFPYTSTEIGADKDQVRLHWGQSLKGQVAVTVRMDA